MSELHFLYVAPDQCCDWENLCKTPSKSNLPCIPTHLSQPSLHWNYLIHLGLLKHCNRIKHPWRSYPWFWIGKIQRTELGKFLSKSSRHMHRIPKRPHQCALIETETLDYIYEKLKFGILMTYSAKYFYIFMDEESLFQSFLLKVFKQK